MSDKPKHWDSWKGRVLRAIIYERAETWSEVRDKSGLTQKQMLKVIKEMRRAGILEYREERGEKRFRVLDDALYKAYQTAKSEPVVKSVKPTVPEHLEWIKKWIETNEVNASPEHQHFFLHGTDLSDFVRRLMDRAKQSILVVNPFVEKARLGTSLRNAAKRDVKVMLVCRRPKRKPDMWEFHKTLTKAGVHMYYSGGYGGEGGIHSKMVIVDEEIAIVSSMNFTKNSESYTWETGIVTLNKDVVDSAVDSIRELSQDDEISSAKEAHQRF